jgi:hypothetical protein
MKCKCKCHQTKSDKSNCGDCNNTGIQIELEVIRRDSSKMLPFKDKPYFD